MDLSKLTNEELLKLKIKFAGEVSKKTCGTSSSESSVQVANPAPIKIKEKLFKLKQNDIQIIISKNTINNGLLEIKEIPKDIAKEIIIKNHYSKSWYHNFGFINVGIFKNKKLLGVASFGLMKVPSSYKKVCDKITKDEMVELNRLWIDDELKKNAETILISSSIKIIKQKYPQIKIIQSFADGRLGCGTIYKASSFKYYGFHETEFFEDTKTGKVYHEMVFHSSTRPGVITRNLLMIYGEFKKFKVNTYRYLYILDRKIVNKIKFQELPYPKYNKGIKYLEFEKDINVNKRFMDNAIKYMFYKLGKINFSFDWMGKKYNYTKKEYENNITIFDKIKRERRKIDRKTKEEER